MRRARVLLGALIVLAGAYVYLATSYPRQRVPDRPYFAAPRPWVVAHRGGGALAPENTTEAFRRAATLSVDVLEMDLRVTADGAIVVIHDNTVDRTTNGHGLVAELSLGQLQALRRLPFPGCFGGLPLPRHRPHRAVIRERAPAVSGHPTTSTVGPLGQQQHFAGSDWLPPTGALTPAAAVVALGRV